MTALEPDLREPAAPVVQPTISELVGPQLPEVTLPSRIDANIAGIPRAAPIPQGVDTSIIVPNLPDARKAFVNKYSELGPALTNLPPAVRSTLLKLDMQRMNKGQQPLSKNETLAVLYAAVKKKPATEPPENKSVMDMIQGIPGAVVSDVAATAKAIPAIAFTWNKENPLLKEIGDIPHAGERIQEAMDNGANPLQAFLEAPGIRMIPGAYAAGNLVEGPTGWKEMLEHPGLTALDVLPYAGKLAKGTAVGRTAAAEKYAFTHEATLEAALRKGATPEAALAQAEKAALRKAGAHPLLDVLTKKLREEGVDPITGSALEPSALGRVVGKGGASRPGQFLKTAFGADSRQVAAAFADGTSRVEVARLGESAVKEGPLGAHARLAATERLAAEADELVPPARRAELTREAQLGAPGWKSSARNEAEQAFLDRMDEVRQSTVASAIDEGAAAVDSVTGEVYSPSQAKRLNSLRDKLGKREARFAEEVAPSVEKAAADAQSFLDGLHDKIAEARDLARRSKKSDPPAALAAQESIREILPQIRQAKIDLDRVAELQRAIADAADPTSPATWADAHKVLGDMKRRPTSLSSPAGVGPMAAPATAKVGTVPRLSEALGSLRKAEAKLSKAEAAAPGRWHLVLEKEISRRMVDDLVGQGADPAVAAKVVAERQWGAIDGFSKKAWSKIADEVGPTWKAMRDAGYDPWFVPTLARGQEGALYGTMRAKVPGLTIAKNRQLGFAAPQIADMSVSFDAAATQMLRQQINRDVLAQVETQFARRWGDITERYMDRARADVKANPRLSMAEGELAVREQAEALAAKEWVHWNPNEAGTPTPMVRTDPDALYLPKHLQHVVEQATSPKAFSALQTLDPITGTFRVSVLALSPRWHLYNIIGNALMVAGTEGVGAFKYWNEARRAIKATRAGEEAVLPSRLVASLEGGMRDLADDSAFLKGVSERQRFEKITQSLPARAGAGLVKKSYQLNAFFDDTTRVMAYLSGEGKALKKGWLKDEAAIAGLESAKKASAFWVDMTPYERQVLRRVFPFYSFTRKIMGLITQMPLDHPVRTAIMANIAAAELEDLGEGMPLDWLNSVPLGKENAQGDQLRLSLNGLNPFSDAANLFTLQGFIAGANPVLGAIAAQTGADLGKGSSAFGTRTYDPGTGKLTTAKPSLAGDILGSVIPQAGALYRATGWDAQFEQLRRQNPEVADRMQASSLGLPTPFRTMNPTETRMTSELARMKAQKEAWDNALATGDWSEAEKYPGLRTKLYQLKSLAAAGLLGPYHPAQGPAPGATGLASALQSQVPWPT